MERGEGVIEIDGGSVSCIFKNGEVVGRSVFRLERNVNWSHYTLFIRMITHDYGLSLTSGDGRIGDG